MENDKNLNIKCADRHIEMLKVIAKYDKHNIDEAVCTMIEMDYNALMEALALR
jgi:hypothetical protein